MSDDGVHVDYTTIMNSATIDFPSMYEVVIGRFFDEKVGEKTHPMTDELCEKLKAKRDFGLKKYGEHSFQSSFQNAMTSPVLDHLEEELLDSINYLLHIKFQLLFMPTTSTFPDAALGQIMATYSQLKFLKKTLENPGA